jgi:hypothetical protein
VFKFHGITWVSMLIVFLHQLLIPMAWRCFQSCVVSSQKFTTMWHLTLMKWIMPHVSDFPKCESWGCADCWIPKRGCFVISFMYSGAFWCNPSWICFQSARIEFHNGVGDGWKCLVEKNQTMDGGHLFQSLSLGCVHNACHWMTLLKNGHFATSAYD